MQSPTMQKLQGRPPRVALRSCRGSDTIVEDKIKGRSADLDDKDLDDLHIRFMNSPVTKNEEEQTEEETA